jgi:hypothetical protein
MRKNATEIYNNIVNAKIGESIPTRHKNGIEYSYSIEDALKQQEYKDGTDFERIFDWKTCQTYIKKLAPISEYKQPQHNIKIGDIFYNSWGYDQTNIDYFQVVSVTAKTVSLRQIKSESVNYDAYQMTGNSVPVKDAFKGCEVIRKTPYLSGGKWRISFEYGAGALWDGKPMCYSCYA